MLDLNSGISVTRENRLSLFSLIGSDSTCEPQGQNGVRVVVELVLVVLRALPLGHMVGSNLLASFVLERR